MTWPPWAGHPGAWRQPGRRRFQEFESSGRVLRGDCALPVEHEGLDQRGRGAVLGVVAVPAGERGLRVRRRERLD